MRFAVGERSRSNPILRGGRSGKRAPCSFFEEQKESCFDISDSLAQCFTCLPNSWADPFDHVGLVQAVPMRILLEEKARCVLSAGVWTGAQQALGATPENPFCGL